MTVVAVPAVLAQIVFGLALLTWAWVALRAGSLADSATPRELQRAAGRLLAGLAIGVGAAVGLVVVPAAALVAPAAALGADPLAAAPPAFPSVSFASVSFAAVAFAAVAVAAPRLVAVRRAARMFNGIGVMSPALRQQAAHPLLAWPLQVTAFAAVGAALVVHVEAYRAPLAVLAAVALASAVTWGWLVRRHRRLRGAVVVAWKGTFLTPHVKKVPLQTLRQ